MFDPEMRVECPQLWMGGLISFLLWRDHTRKSGSGIRRKVFCIGVFLLLRYDCKDWVDLGKGEGNKEREKIDRLEERKK